MVTYCNMESKGRKGQWEFHPRYKGWVSALKADKRKALCQWCDQTIDVSSMGESALNKIQELTDLDTSLNSKLEKLKE